MIRLVRRIFRRRERGFTLVEAVAALAIIGTSVVGAVVLLGTTVNSSAKSEDNTSQQHLVRSQIELIKQSPFQDDPTLYPTIQKSADGSPIVSVVKTANSVTVTFEDRVILSFSVVTDPIKDPETGTPYTYPTPDGFAEASSGYARQLRADVQSEKLKVSSPIWKVFSESPPESLAELARRYQDLFVTAGGPYQDPDERRRNSKNANSLSGGLKRGRNSFPS